MQKTRILSSSKRNDQLQEENYTDSVTKPRTSAHGRFTKTLKFVPKSTANHFQIRKPLNVYMIEELSNLGRKTYYQRVHILAQNNDLLQADFRECLQRNLDKIFEICEKKKCSPDHFSGLFIVMGCTHTYLMIEGAEDMLANFFQELALVHHQFWTSSRVFLVEDKIGGTLFSCFYSRRSAVININEKYPPSTPNDYKQMVVQHFKLKEKVQSLTETLSLQLKNDSTLNLNESSKSVTSDPFVLPADPYNKLLPEVQRIDLMLQANKFYRTVKDFSQTYRVLQFYQDEDAFTWPIQNNYMPLDVFERSEFDVNLTFGNYSQEESPQDQDEVFSNDVQ